MNFSFLAIFHPHTIVFPYIPHREREQLRKQTHDPKDLTEPWKSMGQW